MSRTESQLKKTKPNKTEKRYYVNISVFQFSPNIKENYQENLKMTPNVPIRQNTTLENNGRK